MKSKLSMPLKVKCTNANKSCQFLTKDKIYEVAVIIYDGINWKNKKESGFILINEEVTYPYIWDFQRFEVVDEE